MLLKDDDLEGLDYQKDQDIILLLNTEGFQENILKAQLEIRKNKDEDKNDLAKTAALNIVQELELSDSWTDAIQKYIITGNNKMLRTRRPWSVTFTYEKDSMALDPKNVRDVHIHLHPETNEKDLEKAFRAARKLFRDYPSYQPRTTLKRDLEMLRLRVQDKVPSTEIARLITDKYGLIIDESYVNDRVSKLKKRLGMR